MALLLWATLGPVGLTDVVVDIGQEPVGEALRIGVPGCATGEEAYTLAISLLEFFRMHRAARPFQIFATNVNTKALALARAGGGHDARALLYAAGPASTRTFHLYRSTTPIA